MFSRRQDKTRQDMRRDDADTCPDFGFGLILASERGAFDGLVPPNIPFPGKQIVTTDKHFKTEFKLLFYLCTLFQLNNNNNNNNQY
jgi:hypothetical protein